MIKNTDYTDYFMYAIGPLAILYFLYETFKERGITEETNRRLHIHPFLSFSGHSTNKVVVLSALCKDNLRNNLLFFEINLILLTIKLIFCYHFSPIVGLLWLLWQEENRT
jgi:POT family proton-dependent oligopeptide transporter